VSKIAGLITDTLSWSLPRLLGSNHRISPWHSIVKGRSPTLQKLVSSDKDIREASRQYPPGQEGSEQKARQKIDCHDERHAYRGFRNIANVTLEPHRLGILNSLWGQGPHNRQKDERILKIGALSKHCKEHMEKIFLLITRVDKCASPSGSGDSCSPETECLNNKPNRCPHHEESPVQSLGLLIHDIVFLCWCLIVERNILEQRFFEAALISGTVSLFQQYSSVNFFLVHHLVDDKLNSFCRFDVKSIYALCSVNHLGDDL
jgi:hypothetical protein